MIENKRFNKHIPDSCYTSCVVIIDNHTDKGFADIDDIVDLLNELHNKYIDEYALRETLQLDLQRVEEENKELKKENKEKNEIIEMYYELVKE